MQCPTSPLDGVFLAVQASIGHIYVSDLPCERVFFPEKTWENKEFVKF
jgi:hypothetical protein